MKYKIIDRQNDSYFSGGAEFNGLKEACEQLISYHEIDNDMSVEEELLKQGKIKECWKSLSYLDWGLEKIS